MTWGPLYLEIMLNKLNLLVGQSASGKTRLLNTIYNLGLFVTQEKNFMQGDWNIVIEQSGTYYNWKLKSCEKDGRNIIEHEYLTEQIDGKEELILQRNHTEFIFKETRLPKLPSQQTSAP